MPRSTPATYSSAVAVATPRMTIASASSTRVRRPDPCRVSVRSGEHQENGRVCLHRQIARRKALQGLEAGRPPGEDHDTERGREQAREQRRALVCLSAVKRGRGHSVAHRTEPVGEAPAVGLRDQITGPPGSEIAHVSSRKFPLARSPRRAASSRRTQSTGHDAPDLGTCHDETS